MKEITSEVKNIIENNVVAFATVDKKGNPNVIGVAYVKVVSDNQIVITDNFMKQTKENIEKNNNVCLAVWDKKWNGYKLVGKAKYFTKGKWKTFVENMKENKWLSAKGAIIIKISNFISLG